MRPAAMPKEVSTSGRLAACVGLAALLLCVPACQAKTVHLVFSNHLDIGFDGISPELGTDNNVINKYFDVYFPAAISIAETFRERNGTERFRYMTHSYLVSLFMDCPSGMAIHCPNSTAIEAFTAAVKRGDIYWHALPHNAELEVCDVPLLEYLVQLTHEVDALFGLLPKTVMSQRDVPSFTRNAIPVLVGQGVKAVSVGVNMGSAPPDVPHPTPFIWRDEPSGSELLAMWHPGGYSGTPVDSGPECAQVDGFDHVLCAAWKFDNSGPQPVDLVLDIFNQTRAAFPGATVIASTFEDFAAPLLAEYKALNLPVVTQEIGDTWIRGVASDYEKTAAFRALMRARRAIPPAMTSTPAYRNFSRFLAKIPEHTWGPDTKESLPDYTNWGNTAFHALLADGADIYTRSINAWDRQYDYLRWAVDAYQAAPQGASVAAAMAEIAANKALPDTAGYGLAPAVLNDTAQLHFASPAWSIDIDPATGALAGLQRVYSLGERGAQWASAAAPLGQFYYSTYSEDDFDIIWNHYAYQNGWSWWFPRDFGKPGCAAAGARRADEAPKLTGVWGKQGPDSFHVVTAAKMADWAVRDAGAPVEVWVDIRSPPNDTRLFYDVLWTDKTPTRLPEAAWVRFSPDAAAANASSWRMSKLGAPMSPSDVLRNGSYSQHAVDDAGIAVQGAGTGAWERLSIGTLDAALVSPGDPTPFPNVVTPPDLTKGMTFNLANNIWGTNYPMWQPYGAFSSSFRFRFIIEAQNASAAVQPRARSAEKDLLD